MLTNDEKFGETYVVWAVGSGVPDGLNGCADGEAIRSGTGSDGKISKTSKRKIAAPGQ